MPLSTHNTPPALCPKCGYHMDVAGNADGHKAPPVPGDGTICMACGGVLIFTDTLGVRLATQQDYQTFSPEELAAIGAALILRNTAIERGRIDPEKMKRAQGES